MEYIHLDQSRPLDLILLGRIAIDFNPAWNDQVKEDFKPLRKVHNFEMYVGGSPANVALGTRKHGMKVGFIGMVSDDQFGDFVTEYFAGHGIDTSRIVRAKHGEKLGLTFTEMCSATESHILMYRNMAADLSLDVDDIDEAYIASSKALLISGCALAQSPSREAALKAMMYAEKVQTPVIFDIDYREYNWKSKDEIGVYYGIAAGQADVILGSREEYDLAGQLIRPGMDDRETASYWHGRGAKIVVIKHGKEGSTAYTNDGQNFSIRPFPIKKLKGFGGGDGYASAFLYGLLEGWDVIDCLEFGSASASLLVASHSCADSMPGVGDIKNYIDECKQRYGELVARV